MSDMFNIPRVSGTFSYECARNPENVKHVGRFETKNAPDREMLNISWVLDRFETKNAPDQRNVKHV